MSANEVFLTNFNSKEEFVRENTLKHLNSRQFYDKINNITQIRESSWLKVYYCPNKHTVLDENKDFIPRFKALCNAVFGTEVIITVIIVKLINHWELASIKIN